MKQLLVKLVLLAILASKGQAQNAKKDLDTTAFNTWGHVLSPTITNDGKYAGYFTTYGLINDFNSPKTLTVKSIDGKWTKDFGPNIISYSFPSNNRNVLILDDKNMLQVVQLGSGNLLKTYKASSFQLFEYEHTGYLLIKSPDNSITLVNQKNNQEIKSPDVQSYDQSANKKRLFLLKDNNTLSFIDLPSMKETEMGEFKGMSNFTLDNKGETIAFIMDASVWLCNAGKSKPVKLADNFSLGIDNGLYISGISKFSQGNERLFITLAQKPVKKEIEPGTVKVMVWNYKDARLRTDPGKMGKSQSFFSYINLKDQTITQVQQKFENVRFLNEANTDFISIEYVKGADYERHWNQLAVPKYFIYDCRNKARYPVAMRARSISPDGKYVIGVDSVGVNYIVWSTKKHQQYNLTKHLRTIPDQKGISDDDKKFWSLAGWIDQHILLLYDENDIWQFDVSDSSKSINLTYAVGKREGLVFRLGTIPSNEVLGKDYLSFVWAFNKKNKQSGFYKLSQNGKIEPQRLAMNDAENGRFFVKSRYASIYIVQKERVDSSPNFFVTEDFRSFQQLTNMYPERGYKWLTSELIDFTTLDAKPSQAIVYKPIDLDPNKKYPVIIYYYQKFSDELNKYLQPEPAGGDLNIPWFVSKGYVIVKPDIQYAVMKPGESAVNSVEGVAKYLTKLSYIDSVHMGIMGHSWGAFQTNYIVTHSDFFKAAVSASGNSNLISAVTSLTRGGANYKDISTYTRYERLGKTLWQRPDLYINNSPILDAAKIETPMLLMANERDGIINVEQGIGFFWSLRRLGKPAWLLQYEGEDHGLAKLENQLDYSQKTLDFFDYYLKEKPMPQWMKKAL
nr:prolyl oligopeptidase family serine peptidase [uncultured Pedobacter sp.]